MATTGRTVDWHFKDCLQIPKIVVGVYKANGGGAKVGAHVQEHSEGSSQHYLGVSDGRWGGSRWLRVLLAAGGGLGFPSGGAPPEPRDKLETRTPLNR